MRSCSGLFIDWIPPQLDDERWEFFNHPAKQSFYRRHELTWEALLAASQQATLVPWPRGPECDGFPVHLAYAAYDDYLTYLLRAPRNYRQNYSRLEQSLQRAGSLTLPAPIVLVCAGEGLLFSGWRRLCLAWNYGMVPYAWRVLVPPKTDE